MSMAKSDPGPLSLNTATVKERWGLAECIEGCARHGIPGISPWRDVLQAMGVEEAARQIRDAGLTVTGLCRGGMFTAPDAAGGPPPSRTTAAPSPRPMPSAPPVS